MPASYSSLPRESQIEMYAGMLKMPGLMALIVLPQGAVCYSDGPSRFLSHQTDHTGHSRLTQLHRWVHYALPWAPHAA